MRCPLRNGAYKPRLRLPGHDPTDDPIAGLAGRVCPVVVRPRVDHDGRTILVEEAPCTAGQAQTRRDSVGHRLAVGGRMEVRQIACMRSARIKKTVLLVVRIEVPSRRGERRLALAYRV